MRGPVNLSRSLVEEIQSLLLIDSLKRIDATKVNVHIVSVKKEIRASYKRESRAHVLRSFLSETRNFFTFHNSQLHNPPYSLRYRLTMKSLSSDSRIDI